MNNDNDNGTIWKSHLNTRLCVARSLEISSAILNDTVRPKRFRGTIDNQGHLEATISNFLLNTVDGLTLMSGDISMVSCQKGPSRHAYVWQIGPFWQDTLDIGIVMTKFGFRPRQLPTN